MQSNTVLTPLLNGIVSSKMVTEEEIKKAIAEKGKNSKPILPYLVDKKLIDPFALMVYLSNRYHVPMIDLDQIEFDELVVKQIKLELMEKYHVFPVSIQKNILRLAVVDPTDIKVIEDIRFALGVQVYPAVAESTKIAKAISQYKNSDDNDILVIGEDEDLYNDDEEESTGAFNLEEGLDGNEAQNIRVVNEILLAAIKRGASDIHIEPYEAYIRVRYRIDGVLHNVKRQNKALREGISSRLKIMCTGLDISERRMPQDGRMRIKIPNTKRIIDFRVSFLPTVFGETIVLRILDSSSSKVPISSLGFLPKQQQEFEDAIKKPYGMILVTGPTGSGKTTTLYTALNVLNDGLTNISTAEDPVEIPVFGINQVNINDKIGLNFATALRSFLRQDPDIIMVGEIRDLETAETAIKAAQTGHLVLATLHTNDSPQTLTRLQNMGIPNYNVASSVHLVMAQRLARKLCPACKQPHEVPTELLAEAGFAAHELHGWTPMKPVGCDECRGGYKGRIGLYQVMPISDEIREIILSNGTASAIARQAEKEGVLTMRQSGLIRVKEGVTSLEEVLRVTNL